MHKPKKLIVFAFLSTIVFAQLCGAQERKLILFREKHTQHCTSEFIRNLTACNEAKISKPGLTCYALKEGGILDQDLDIGNHDGDSNSLEESGSYILGDIANFFYRERWSVKLIYYPISSYVLSKSLGLNSDFDASKFFDQVSEFMVNLKKLSDNFTVMRGETKRIDHLQIVTSTLSEKITTYMQLENTNKPQDVKNQALTDLGNQNELFHRAAHELMNSIHGRGGILDSIYMRLALQKPYYKLTEEDFAESSIKNFISPTVPIDEKIEYDRIKYLLVLRDKIMSLKIKTMIDLALKKLASFNIFVETGKAHLHALEQNWEKFISESGYQNINLALETLECDE